MKALVTDPGVRRFASVLEAQTTDYSFEYCDPGDEQRINELLPDADVFIGSKCTAQMLGTAAKLRFIHVPGAGTEKLAPEVWASDLVIANVFEHERSIAEYILMAILALSHDLHTIDADLREGVWRNPMINPALPLRRVLAGQTIGLVGYGHIGQEVAGISKLLGMKVAAIHQRPRSDPESTGLEFVGGPDDLPHLLEISDVVVVVVPLTEQTTGLIGAKELHQMKRTAFLINVARGEVVQERALYDALRSGSIAGAALDVWYRVRPTTEDVAPPSVLPFGELPNVLMTPHVSGVTEHTFSGRARVIGENLESFRTGSDIRNLVSNRHVTEDHPGEIA